MKVINPATEEIIKELQENSHEEVQMKYELLVNGQKQWANESIDLRIDCIKRFNKLLLNNIDSLSLVLTNEAGKPLSQSKGEIKGASYRASYFVEHSKKILADRIAHQEAGLTEKVIYEPLGIIANISAWNYPYLVGVNVFIPALIAGNAVMYKPSEYSTLTGLEIEKLLHASGVPENVFSCVIGGREAGQFLLDLPLNGYFFTGSYKTGEFIYQQVAHKMVPCQMELGGKDPLYVSNQNSNISSVAKSVAEGVFYNNGQSCCAVERVYVNAEVYDQFLSEFLDEVKSFKVGNPMDAETFIGPLTRKEQLAVLQRQIADATSKGAEIALGGKVQNAKGYYFEPTVLVNVNHNMLVMKEESFGPIIGIQKVDNLEDALELMKDTDYGLTAAIYTASEDEFNFTASQMNTGSFYWNCCDRVSANLPWSGRKNSGIGSTLSEEGIRAFVQPKALHIRK